MSNLLQDIIQAHKKTNAKHTVAWHDNVLLIYPVPQDILPDFTVREKTLECGPHTQWKQEIVYKELEMFETLEWGGAFVFTTYQGFLNRAMQALIKKKLTFSFLDKRYASHVNGQFPKPNLSLMYGFRFSQQDLISKGLAANMSGLIGAPTRYGLLAACSSNAA